MEYYLEEYFKDLDNWKDFDLKSLRNIYLDAWRKGQRVGYDEGYDEGFDHGCKQSLGLDA